MERLHANSFFSMLSRSCMLIMLIPISVYLILYAYFLSDSYTQSLQEEFDNKTEMLTTQVFELTNNMSFISLELLNRSSFLDSIRKLYFNADTAQKAAIYYANVADAMVTYGFFQNTYELVWIDGNGYYYSTTFTVSEQQRVHQIPQTELAEYDWYTSVTEAGTTPVLLNLGSTAVTSETGNSISFVRGIAAPTKRIGLLIVQVDLAGRPYLFEPLEDAGADYGIFSGDGVSLYASAHFPQMSEAQALAYVQSGGAHNVNINGQRYMVSVFQKGDMGLFSIALFPHSIYLKQLAVSLLPALSVALLTISLTAIWIIRFSKGFSRPLMELTSMIRETTLDDLRQPREIDLVHAPEELQSLQKSYLYMVGRVNTMVDEKLDWISKEADMRLRFLQYQINPHFMYNTLNVIGIMGVEAHSAKIYEACQMLSQLLRYSLEDYRKKATFQEEVASIHAYLSLMKLRYEHKVSYNVSYDSRLDEYLITRFTLQPFVENIFEHAFDMEHPVVSLQIRIGLENEEWRILIRDNGAGISEDTLKKLCQSIDLSMRSESDSTPPQEIYEGIGMKNTIVRLHVFFHGAFHYKIENNIDGGCQITLWGKLMRGEP